MVRATSINENKFEVLSFQDVLQSKKYVKARKGQRVEEVNHFDEVQLLRLVRSIV